MVLHNNNNYHHLSTYIAPSVITYSILLSFLQQPCKAGTYYYPPIADGRLRISQNGIQKNQVHKR